MSSFQPNKPIKPEDFVRIRQSGERCGETMYVVTATEGNWANIRQVDPHGRRFYKEQQCPIGLLKKV